MTDVEIIPDYLEKLKIDEFSVNFIKNDKSITEYAINSHKLWEDWLEKYIKEAYIENTNMIDIGANIGTFSLMMSRYISPGSNIFSFEPVYSNTLETNIKENKLDDKIKMFPIGLSYKQKKIKGGFIDFSIKSNYGFTQLDYSNTDIELTDTYIDILTLDSFNIDNVSFIKIDVEGHERNVLDGAINTIVKNTPTILIEIWSTSENAKIKYSNDKNLHEAKTQLAVFEFLFNLGYICIPVSPVSDDFLFVHYKKKELLNKIINNL
jgi:FkbM family methyltransferase